MFPSWLPFIIITAVTFAITDTLRRFFGPQINPIFSTFAAYIVSALLALSAFYLFFNHDTASTWQATKKLWPFFVFNGMLLAVGVSAQVTWLCSGGAPIFSYADLSWRFYTDNRSGRSPDFWRKLFHEVDTRRRFCLARHLFIIKQDLVAGPVWKII